VKLQPHYSATRPWRRCSFPWCPGWEIFTLSKVRAPGPSAAFPPRRRHIAAYIFVPLSPAGLALPWSRADGGALIYEPFSPTRRFFIPGPAVEYPLDERRFLLARMSVLFASNKGRE